MRIRYRMILAFLLIGLIPTVIFIVQANRQLSASLKLMNEETSSIAAGIVPDASNNVNVTEVSNQVTRAQGRASRSIRSAGFMINLSGIILIVVVTGAAFFLTDRFISPYEWMAVTAGRAFRVIQNMFKNIPLPPRQDEVSVVTHTLGVMESQLKEEYINLDKQINLRSGELRQRTLQLRTAAQIVRDTADILDVKQLLNSAVSLISERFSFYHVGIYMLDEKEEKVTLEAGYLTGSGTKVTTRSYLPGEGIVGLVAQKGELYLADDLEEDKHYIKVPELPLSRSSVTLPLKVRGGTTGVLDIQSSALANFNEDDIAVLQIVADQIGLAVENARLFERSRTALEAERRAYGEISRREWLEMVSNRPEWGYRSDKSGLSSSSGKWQPWMLEAAQQGQTVIAHANEMSIVSLPVKVRGQMIGVLDFRKSGESSTWTEEEIGFLTNLTEQLSQALESARLYQETQLRAEREHIISDITSKVRASTNVNVILQTAVRELADALRISKSSIQLRSVSAAPEETQPLASEDPLQQLAGPAVGQPPGPKAGSGSNGGSSHE